MTTAKTEIQEILNVWTLHLKCDIEERHEAKNINPEYDYQDIKQEIKIVRDLRKCVKLLS
jgi:hypothetical protein